MYYKRLIEIYHESDCHLTFSERLLEQFDNFIRDEKKTDRNYLNPYRFALATNISVADSIKFFLYFTGEKKLLIALPFIDCFTPNCTGSRIFLNECEGIEEGVLSCEHCGREYLLEEVKKFILLYFKLKPEIQIPQNQMHLTATDPNSTFNILEGLPDILKVQSPSLTITENEGDLQEEQAISLEQVIEQNIDLKGNPIINGADLLEMGLRERLSRGRI